MRRRQALLAVAVAAAAVGLALAFVPALSVSLSLPELAPLAIAAVAVVLGARRAWGWVTDASEETVPPAPERGRPLPTPGDDVDDRLASIPRVGVAAGDRRAIQVREDLREVAVEALVEFRGHSEDRAEDLLASGRWTDDELAAEFFASLDGAGSSLAESLTGTIAGEGPFHRRARHAAAEIDAIVDERGEA